MAHKGQLHSPVAHPRNVLCFTGFRPSGVPINRDCYTIELRTSSVYHYTVAVSPNGHNLRPKHIVYVINKCILGNLWCCVDRIIIGNVRSCTADAIIDHCAATMSSALRRAVRHENTLRMETVTISHAPLQKTIGRHSIYSSNRS